eukprot:GFUD01119184.1.p1 GENE.GFUD01119184.1~~GFUD01119184.1.p1  ORF type:complete len:104 (-),score=11.58 GFUD01119184.1:240-551(-)
MISSEKCYDIKQPAEDGGPEARDVRRQELSTNRCVRPNPWVKLVPPPCGTLSATLCEDLPGGDHPAFRSAPTGCPRSDNRGLLKPPDQVTAGNNARNKTSAPS